MTWNTLEENPFSGRERVELRVNFNFLISEWQWDGSGGNNRGNVLCSHPTLEVGQHPGMDGKQAGMKSLLGIPTPLLPKDTFLSFFFSLGNGLEPTARGNRG